MNAIHVCYQDKYLAKLKYKSTMRGLHQLYISCACLFEQCWKDTVFFPFLPVSNTNKPYYFANYNQMIGIYCKSLNCHLTVQAA